MFWGFFVSSSIFEELQALFHCTLKTLIQEGGQWFCFSVSVGSCTTTKRERKMDCFCWFNSICFGSDYPMNKSHEPIQECLLSHEMTFSYVSFKTPKPLDSQFTRLHKLYLKISLLSSISDQTKVTVSVCRGLFSKINQALQFLTAPLEPSVRNLTNTIDWTRVSPFFQPRNVSSC